MVNGEKSEQINTDPTPQSQDAGQAPSEPQPRSQAELWAELRDLTARAKSGDRSAMPRLREFFAKTPELWRNNGDLSLQVQASWTELICGKNLHMKECVVRRVNELKFQWAGESPSPAEVLLVERIIIAWLRLAYIESREAQHAETSLRWAQFQMQRQALAEKQLRMSIDDLETLRKAQRPIMIDVRQPQTHMETDTAPSANGHKQKLNGSSTPKVNSQNGAAGPIGGNRHNGRVNGNRVAHILDDVSIGVG
jgi:hypothetical protein